jgi:hypothetical protein
MRKRHRYGRWRLQNGFTAAVLPQPITTANLTSGALVSLTVSGDVTAP